MVERGLKIKIATGLRQSLKNCLDISLDQRTWCLDCGTLKGYINSSIEISKL